MNEYYKVLIEAEDEMGYVGKAANGQWYIASDADSICFETIEEAKDCYWKCSNEIYPEAAIAIIRFTEEVVY